LNYFCQRQQQEKPTVSTLKTDPKTIQFRAAAGNVQGFGSTPHDALEALMQNLKTRVATPIVIWPYNQGDEHFTDAQQRRLEELKARHGALTPSEHQELEQLVEASFDATIARTQSLQRLKS
jgi:hypothetical protein